MKLAFDLNSRSILTAFIILLLALAASTQISRYIICERLEASAKKADTIFKRELKIAESSLYDIRQLLDKSNASQCNHAVVTAMEEHLFNSSNQEIVWVRYHNENTVCSVIGITQMPMTNYYESVSQFGNGLQLLQMKNQLNLEAYMPVYAKLQASGYDLFVQLGSTLELRSLLDLEDTRVQLEVYSESGQLLLKLNQLDSPGQSSNFYSAETGLTFKMTKLSAVSYHLTGFVLLLLLILGMAVFGVGRLAIPHALAVINHKRFSYAFNKGQFHLVYQPIYDLKQDKTIGVEVLLRWRDSSGKTKDTGEFIGLLEQDPLMPKVTRWVLKTAFSELAGLLDSGQLNWFSVNVSARDIEQGGLLGYLMSLHSQGYPMAQLSLELTERIPVTQWHVLQQFIRISRSMGCKIKLDDAGTGYGGSLYIQELEFDYLKIDREFVRRLGTPESKLALIQSYQSIAKEMNIDVIAEGVNDAIQAELLYQLGITTQQGWLYAKGLDRKALADYLQSTSLGLPD